MFQSFSNLIKKKGLNQNHEIINHIFYLRNFNLETSKLFLIVLKCLIVKSMFLNLKIQ